MPSPENKGLLTDIANKFVSIFKIDRFSGIVNSFVRKKYAQGAVGIENKFNFNIQFGDQERDISLLNKHTFDNIKGMTDELQEDLRQELQRGLLGNESPKELRKRIANIFRGNNPTRFHFENRMKMIARTEGKRAANMAKFANVERLDRKAYKYITLGPRPCPGCVRLSKDEPIPLKQKFVHVQNKKVTREQYPPFHPNCMCKLIITQEKSKE